MAQPVILVPTPPVGVPRLGVVTTLPIIQDGERFAVGGVKFVPPTYLAGGRSSYTVPALTVKGTVPGPVDAIPFVVYASEQESAWSLDVTERAQRVQDQLAAIESFEIAAELWSGTIISGTQRVLNSTASDVLTVSAVSASASLGQIEAGLATLAKGARGMVHVTAQTLASLALDGAIRREGNVWLTPSDHIVVMDAGYPGTGPSGHPRAASSIWMYGTSMIRLRLAPVYVQGPRDGDTDPGQFDRAVNTVTFSAIRVALIQWDEGVHVAAETNLTVPLVAGVS